MSPRTRIIVGLVSLVLAPCFMAGERRGAARNDVGTVASDFRMLAWQAALSGGFLALFDGIAASVLCRRLGLSWRAYRFRHQNRYWSIATPLWLWPLPVALVLAPQLYGPIDARVSACLLARSDGWTLVTLWIAPFAGLTAYYVVVWLRESPKATSRCESCGYDLTGTTGDRCPECGHSISWRVPWPRGDK